MSATPRAGSSPAGPRVTLQVPRPGGGPRSELLEMRLGPQGAHRPTETAAWGWLGPWRFRRTRKDEILLCGRVLGRGEKCTLGHLVLLKSGDHEAERDRGPRHRSSDSARGIRTRRRRDPNAGGGADDRVGLGFSRPGATR